MPAHHGLAHHGLAHHGLAHQGKGWPSRVRVPVGPPLGMVTAQMTLAAAWKDARYSLGKLWELRRFPKEAVITDKGWLAGFVDLLDPAIPFVKVRAFKPEDYEKALTWAGDIEGGPDA